VRFAASPAPLDGPCPRPSVKIAAVLIPSSLISSLVESLSPSSKLKANPYLHVDDGKIYNPFTHGSVTSEDPLWEPLRSVVKGETRISDLPRDARDALKKSLFLVPERQDLSRSFHLRYVSLEAHTVCNQACYFCPVSVDPRKAYYMPTDLYERIVEQLTEFKDTIDGVAMINYNEPTADRRFLDQVRLLKTSGLSPAVLTNGSGLTPDRVDAIVAMGGLRYLSINISSIDRQTYAADRGADQLDMVLKNLDHAKDKPVAREMDIIVLGRGDEAHKKAHEEITRYFEGSLFTVRPYEIMDRAGYLPVGLRPDNPHPRLRGCENLGSRPLQHIHITPQGKCVLCCEDYDEKYVVGDLTRQTVREVLEGEELALMRKWIYGLEEAPADFICRKCVFARTK
jgi:hypothetical protein